MKPSEIITADAVRNGIDPEVLLNKFRISLSGKQSIMLQHGDSVLIIRIFAPGMAELHLFTVEKPVALLKSIKYFDQQIKNSDIQAIYGNADNQQIIDLLRLAGLNVVDSDVPTYNWRVNYGSN